MVVSLLLTLLQQEKFKKMKEKRDAHSLRYETIKKKEEEMQKREIKRVIEESRNRAKGLITSIRH